MLFDIALQESFIGNKKKVEKKSKVFSLYESARAISEKNGKELSLEETYFYKYLDEAYIIPLNEETPEAAKKAAEKFIDDANEFINKTSKTMDEKRKKATACALINLGVYILGVCVMSSLPIIGLIALIGSLIPFGFSIKYSYNENKDKKELNNLSNKLSDLKLKVKDQKSKDNIDTLINKIKNNIDNRK